MIDILKEKEKYKVYGACFHGHLEAFYKIAMNIELQNRIVKSLKRFHSKTTRRLFCALPVLHFLGAFPSHSFLSFILILCVGNGIIDHLLPYTNASHNLLVAK